MVFFRDQRMKDFCFVYEFDVVLEEVSGKVFQALVIPEHYGWLLRERLLIWF